MSTDLAAAVFRAASYCTDPICKVHELYRMIAIVEALYPTADKISNIVRKGLLGIELVGWALAALLVTPLGICLRAAGSHLQEDPFIYEQGEMEDKILPDGRSFSLLSWNICCVSGGYSISDGGVMPWRYRIERIARQILEQDADVNCLYETFDAQSGFYLSEILKKRGYGHIYFNIGPKVIGVSSGILVASKYKIENSEFTPFPQETLVGRTKHAAKGIFAFDISSRGMSFARIHATHLQHSEEPAFPTADEVEARRKEMQLMVDKVNVIRDRCIVVTGDLNLDDQEYEASSWHHFFQKGDEFDLGDKTWDGDEFCARMTEKRISGPLNLDHTMVVNGMIRTSLIQTGYHPTSFSREALSDHKGLLSHINLLDLH